MQSNRTRLVTGLALALVAALAFAAGIAATPGGDAELDATVLGSHADREPPGQQRQQPSPAGEPEEPLITGDPVQVGAAKISIEPQPDEAEGQVWAKEGCETFGGDADEIPHHVADFRVRWPQNRNCIYMGGYGIGPMYPMTAVDPEYGLWVRSVAISDEQDTIVLTLIDGTSYFGDYNELCDDCGAHEIARQLGEELGIDPAGFFIASTHSHTAPDFIGGWGGVPQWYMDQVAGAIRDSIREAFANRQTAILDAGEELARTLNAERRNVYRSSEDPFLTWFRALAADENGQATGDVLATVGAFSAHPVTVSSGAGVGDADYPGVFAHAVEQRFGGTGLLLMSGLGNKSPRGNKVSLGTALAGLVPEPGDARVVRGGDVRAAQEFWAQPITNSGLTALGLPGFFDRPFQPVPATLQTGKTQEHPCVSASPLSVHVAVNAARVGDLAITGGPGELFANLTNTVKEQHAGVGIAMPLSQVNDGLGYILQAFESDEAARQVLGFGPTNTFEYEDAYALDRCFGDKVLETKLHLLRTIR